MLCGIFFNIAHGMDFFITFATLNVNSFCFVKY